MLVEFIVYLKRAVLLFTKKVFVCHSETNYQYGEGNFGVLLVERWLANCICKRLNGLFL